MQFKFSFVPMVKKTNLSRRRKVKESEKNEYGPQWTPEEDNLLRAAVYEHGGKKWKTIASAIPDRTPSQCNLRWYELQSSGNLPKRPWCSVEDDKMISLVKKHGPGRWSVIASYLPGRNGKQCRERWHNQLNPNIRKDPWTQEEDDIIIQMQAMHGNCWARITEKLRGRTDNAVKNHWHSSLRSKVKRAAPISIDEKYLENRSNKRTKVVESTPPLELECISPKSRPNSDKENCTYSPNDVMGETPFPWNPPPSEPEWKKAELCMMPIQDPSSEKFFIGQHCTLDSSIPASGDIFSLCDTNWDSEGWEPMQTPSSNGDWPPPPASDGLDLTRNVDEYNLIAAALGDLPFEQDMDDHHYIPIKFPHIHDSTLL